MNIETANRLYEYRKSMGLSQEELAAKIGVSRQAVSKWERAEASPDTDNLIELSKVYGVTLDEMLRGKDEAAPAGEPAPEAVDEAPASEEPTPEEPAEPTEKVQVGWHGIPVHDKHGAKVDIDSRGIFVEENGEQKVYTGTDGHIHKSPDIIEKENEHKRGSLWLKLPYPIVTVIAYILFGTLNVMGGWSYGWIIFLTIPLYYTLVKAILMRKVKVFCYPVLVAMVYLIIGFAFNWWHPGWVLFLTIPLFYWIVD